VKIVLLTSIFLIAGCSTLKQKQSCTIEVSKSIRKEVNKLNRCKNDEVVQSITKNSKGEIEYICAKPKLICE